jgi:preprotein translocase subunit SecG
MMYLAYALLTLHMFVGIFLIGLILLQRGRGGGLAGSFGGMGGQSAFGTKAGDMFTRITIVVAVFWILLACVCILVVSGATKGRFKPGAANAVNKAPADAKAGAKGDAPAFDDEKARKDGAGDGKAVVLPPPAKAEPPMGDEKKPDVKKDEGAGDAKKPADVEAKPAAADLDAPADATKKDNEKPALPEKPDSKKPE